MDEWMDFKQLTYRLGGNPPNGLWIEDENGMKWFHQNGNFLSSIKEGDTEPPYICISDKYNVVDLYNLKVRLLSKSNTFSLEEIINKYKDSDSVVLLQDSRGDQWEFTSLSKTILNQNGESLTDFYDDIELNNLRFMVDYEEKSLPKQDIKDNILDDIESICDDICMSLEKLKNDIQMLRNMK